MGEKTVQVIEEDAGGIAEDLKHVDELQLSTGEVVNASGHVSRGSYTQISALPELSSARLRWPRRFLILLT